MRPGGRCSFSSKPLLCSAARKACTTFIARSACGQLNSVNDPTMNNSVSKKSSDIPMLPDKARCPHACVWCTQLLLETNAARVHAISLRLPGRGVSVNRVKLNQDARWFGVFAVDRAGHCLQASKSKLWARKASAKRSWPSTPSAPADFAQKAPSSHTQCTRSPCHRARQEVAGSGYSRVR